MIEPKDGEWWMVESQSGDKRVMRYWLRDGDSDAVWNVFNDESDSFITAHSTIKPLYKMVNAEEPKPSTKVVYEKVESLLSCIDDHIEEKLYNKVGDEFRKCADCQKSVASTFLAGCLYRKLEKEIDWRDELAERAGLVYDKVSDSFDMNDKYWGSNWVKEFGHLVASLTDKPE